MTSSVLDRGTSSETTEADEAPARRGPFGLDPIVLRSSLAGLVVVAALVVLIPAHSDNAFDLGALTVSALMTAIALPLVFRLFKSANWMIALALALALAPLTITTLQNMTTHDHLRARNHDGGVYLTRAVTQELLDGKNPYATDHTAEVPKVWNPLFKEHGIVVNPLVKYYPYLPGWFLVQAPFSAAAHALGFGWDPRVLYVALMFATAIAVARRPGATWARAAVILGLGTAFTTLYQSWGTNDAVVSALVVLAAVLAAKKPRTAGLVLALAISGKFLLGIAVIPLAVVVYRREGWAGLRRWWTMPASLVATCLPFFIANPKAFTESTLLFNLGATKLRYPTSGLGLPVIAGGTFHGPLLALTTLVLGLVAVVGPAVMAWRWARYEIVPLATAVGVAGLIIPARTFQQPYITILVILVTAGVGLLLAGRAPAEPDRRLTPA